MHPQSTRPATRLADNTSTLPAELEGAVSPPQERQNTVVDVQIPSLRTELDMPPLTGPAQEGREEEEASDGPRDLQHGPSLVRLLSSPSGVSELAEPEAQVREAESTETSPTVASSGGSPQVDDQGADRDYQLDQLQPQLRQAQDGTNQPIQPLALRDRAMSRHNAAGPPDTASTVATSVTLVSTGSVISAGSDMTDTRSESSFGHNPDGSAVLPRERPPLTPRSRSEPINLDGWLLGNMEMIDLRPRPRPRLFDVERGESDGEAESNVESNGSRFDPEQTPTATGVPTLSNGLRVIDLSTLRIPLYRRPEGSDASNRHAMYISPLTPPRPSMFRSFLSLPGGSGADLFHVGETGRVTRAGQEQITHAPELSAIPTRAGRSVESITTGIPAGQSRAASPIQNSSPNVPRGPRHTPATVAAGTSRHTSPAESTHLTVPSGPSRATDPATSIARPTASPAPMAPVLEEETVQQEEEDDNSPEAVARASTEAQYSRRIKVSPSQLSKRAQHAPCCTTI